jgi:hypothetical protein
MSRPPPVSRLRQACGPRRRRWREPASRPPGAPPFPFFVRASGHRRRRGPAEAAFLRKNSGCLSSRRVERVQPPQDACFSPARGRPAPTLRALALGRRLGSTRDDAQGGHPGARRRDVRPAPGRPWLPGVRPRRAAIKTRTRIRRAGDGALGAPEPRAPGPRLTCHHTNSSVRGFRLAIAMRDQRKSSQVRSSLSHPWESETLVGLRRDFRCSSRASVVTARRAH